MLESFHPAGASWSRDRTAVTSKADSSRFHAELVPVLDIEWVTADLHDVALAAMRTAGRRELSLVDCVSFEVMRRRRIEAAFAFDDDFATAGFRVIP